MQSVLYADGCYRLSENVGGWAVVTEDGCEVKTLASGAKDRTSSYEMELRAVLEAIRTVEGPATILCDLKIVVEDVNRLINQKKLPKGRHNPELWEEIAALLADREGISVRWISSRLNRAHGSACQSADVRIQQKYGRHEDVIGDEGVGY